MTLHQVENRQAPRKEKMGQEINTAKAISCFACHHKTPNFRFSHVSTSGFYFDIGLWCRNKGHRQIQALAQCLGVKDTNDLLTKQHLYILIDEESYILYLRCVYAHMYKYKMLIYININVQ